MTIGQKIRLVRKNKKLTQNDISGDKITRNMLSAIENGKASPSLDTLTYISSKLDIPLSYLVSDDEDLFFYEKRAAIKHIKETFSEKKYSSCIHQISKLSGLDDELAYMLAVCHFELGRRSTLGGSLQTARTHFDKTKEFCSKTIYDTSAFEYNMLLYDALVTNIQSPLLELDTKSFEDGIDRCIDYELYKYLRSDLTFNYKNSVYRRHFTARELMKSRQYSEALTLLQEIISEKSPENYNAYVIFGVYSDMEQCAKQLAQFEMAYTYATKRLSMLEGFKS